MKISSPAFSHYGMLPQKYTCEGEDICPQIEISKPPAKTKSFAIIVHDHDAKSGDFVHWIIWNIDPRVREIMEETTPVGAVLGTNDFGQIGWNGPCPPPDDAHHYEFHLYALDTMLDLPMTSRKEDLRDAIKGHILEEASMIGLYEKTL